MSHEITQRNGKAEAVFALTPAWHGLGQVLDHAPTSDEALVQGGLNWTVGQKPLYVRKIESGVESFVAVATGHILNFREDTGDHLGVVGHTYKVVQNHEAFKFVDSLLADGVIKYETAFSLSGGRRVVLVARMPQEFTVADGDQVLSYIMLSTSHDGTGGIRFGPTAVRVVCQNTFRAALARGTVGEISLRHAGNIEACLDQAREILGAAGAAIQEHADVARRLAEVKITDADWAAYLDAVAPLPSIYAEGGEQRVARVQEVRDQIEAIYRSPTCGSTAWGAFNAVTQQVDHLPRRGGSDRARLEARYRVTQEGTGHAIKVAAWNSARHLAECKGLINDSV
jgi:phage/plasmid-like protein (TIGR03299 family)